MWSAYSDTFYSTVKPVLSKIKQPDVALYSQVQLHKQNEQNQSLANVRVSLPKARAGSRDCSVFCIEKCKHLKYKVFI